MKDPFSIIGGLNTSYFKRLQASLFNIFIGEAEDIYTCCAWMYDSGSLAFGTASGSVRIVNYLQQVSW